MGTYRPAFVGRWFFLMLFGMFGVAAVMLLVQVAWGEESLTDPVVLFWFAALPGTPTGGCSESFTA